MLVLVSSRCQTVPITVAAGWQTQTMLRCPATAPLDPPPTRPPPDLPDTLPQPGRATGFGGRQSWREAVARSPLRSSALPDPPSDNVNSRPPFLPRPSPSLRLPERELSLSIVPPPTPRQQRSLLYSVPPQNLPPPAAVIRLPFTAQECEREWRGCGSVFFPHGGGNDKGDTHLLPPADPRCGRRTCSRIGLSR